MPVNASPTFGLQPAAEQQALSTNYISNFNFLNQYLPDVYEKEFARYGNRTVASFLRLVGAELPCVSDLVKWTESGRLHTKYTNCASNGALNANTATITVSDTGVTYVAIRPGQTVQIQLNSNGASAKAIVTSVPTATTFTVAYYNATGQPFSTGALTVWVYGSEFKKGTSGIVGSLEAEVDYFDNTPIILKDKYAVNGSDMAQIGWVEVTTEANTTGYLWYLKSQHETRLRFEDYLETACLEAVPAEAGSGVATQAVNTSVGNKGSNGVFHVVNTRGNVFSGGYATTLADWDSIVTRLDRQGAIEENALFVNRDFGFDISDMLAAQNAGYSGGASWGLFNNDKQMALNLGFTGFRRGYDFYYSDWKYLNDPTLRGNMSTAAATAAGNVTGLLVPAGTTNVYDQILGKSVKRPFLHVRYRSSQAEDRKYKTWITGSAGGAQTSDLDAMEVHFLSERCVCTLGANNFMLFRYGA